VDDPFRKPMRIDKIQESARIYYALKNGVGGERVVSEPENMIRSFMPEPDANLVPGFGIGEIKFPYTQSDVDEAREKSDQIHVYELESQIQTLGRLNKAIEPPFKDACVKAATQDKEDGLAFYTPWDGEKYTNAELTVNPLTAMLRWKKLVESGENIDPQTDEIRWLTRLAQDRHDWYKQALITSPQCVTYVHNYLQDALSAAEGQTSSRLEAACWYVLDELKNVDPLRDYVDFARLRYNGSNAPLPELTPAAAE